MNCNGTLDYATTLSELVNTGPEGDQDLIDEVLAGGEKQGYRFTLERTQDPRQIWFARAEPTVPGETGERCFGINSEGRLFYSREGPVRFKPDGSSEDPRLGD